MTFVNIVDEQGRFSRYKVLLNEVTGQFTKMEYSYLYLRDVYKRVIKQPIGLEVIVEEEKE